MTLAVVTHGTPTSAAGTSAQFVVPTGLTVGQHLQVAVQLFTATSLTLTPGTGWSRCSGANAQTTVGGGDATQIAVFEKVYTGTPGSGATETVCTWTTAGITAQVIPVMVSGQPSSPLDNTNTVATTSANINISHPGLTLAQANELVVAFVYNDDGFTYATPTGWTLIVTTGGMGCFYKIPTAAGPMGATPNFVASSACDQTLTLLATLVTNVVASSGSPFPFFMRASGGAGASGGGGAQAGLHVVTNGSSQQLVDGSGNQFNALGMTEYGIYDDHNSGGTAEWAAITTTVAAEKANGVNLARVRVLASYYNSLGTAARAAYVGQVVTRLGYAKGAGQILLIEPWDPYYLAANFATAYASMYQMMSDIHAAIGNDPSVMWGTGNEPNDTSTGSLTWALWQTAVKGIIANLVSAGYTGPILVDPINWANSGAKGLGFSDTDYGAIETYHAGLLSAHHDIIFSCHQYWYPGWANSGTPIAWSLSRFLSTVLGGTISHVVLVSEFGYDNLTSSPGAGINDTWQAAAVADLTTLALTQKNIAGVVGFAAAWNGDDNRIFVDSDHTTLTTWGAEFFTGAAPPPATLTITNAQAVLQSDNSTVIVSATMSSDLINGVITNSSGTKLAADETPSPNVSWTITGLPLGTNAITISGFTVPPGASGGSVVTQTVSVNIPTPSGAGKMRVGMNSMITHDYITNLVNFAKTAGVTWDRVDVGTGTSMTYVDAAISRGLSPLVMYNPPPATSAATAASQAHALATSLLSRGITEMEFINEPYYNSYTPAAYAACYAAAKTALAGMGITLIAAMAGDYERANATWSQDANGGGWIRDFVSALPSPGISQVDAWCCHPYGASITTVAAEDSGWAAVPNYRSIVTSLGSTKPFYITEIGWDTAADGGAGGQVTAAVKASNFTSVLSDALAKGYIAGVWYYEIINDSTGGFGLFNVTGSASSVSSGDETPAFTAMASWMTTNAASVSG